jgi:hypothetical protein
LTARSMASGSSERRRSWVIPGDPRHRVDSKLMTVEMEELQVADFVPVASTGLEVVAAEAVAEPALPAAAAAGEFVDCCDVVVVVAVPAAFDRRKRRAETSPCSARGPGSMPRRVKRSANEAKHLRAPSATCPSSCWSKVDKASTQAANPWSWGSTFEQSRETTTMAE